MLIVGITNIKLLNKNKALNLRTCDIGKHVDFLVYFRFHGSFHCDCTFEEKRANGIQNYIN